MEKNKLFEIFSEAIGVDINDITFETSSDNVPDWDSLGHLTFLSALDEETNGGSAEIAELTDANNLQEVYNILAKYNL